MNEDEYVDKLGDMAEVLCELASTDIQMAVEPYARLDWHTLRTVAGMLDKLAEGASAADIMSTWIDEYTNAEVTEGDADYEVQLLMPLSFDRGPNGLAKDAIWRQLGDSAMSTGGGLESDTIGVAVRVPASTSRHAVGAKAILVLVTAAHDAGHPLVDLPFVEEVHRMDR